jgi:proline iminopeptidase
MPELEKHLTLVYIEPLGTGASSRMREAPPSLRKRYAADIEAVRRATGEPYIYLLGHSYGGYVVMQYAMDYGDHLDGLILYSTSAVTGKTWSRDAARARKGFKGTSWYEAVAAAMEAPEPPAEYEHDCGRFRRIMPFYFADYEHRRDELDPFVNELRCYRIPRRDVEEGATDDLRPQLTDLRMPTLVITGKRDWLFPPKWARLTARAIKGARVVVLPKSGHMAHVEEPEAFAKAIVDFVNGP